MKTNHLVAFLQAYSGQYRLQWVDDANCLAIFNDDLTMRTALSDLSGGMFSIKVCLVKNKIKKSKGEN